MPPPPSRLVHDRQQNITVPSLISVERNPSPFAGARMAWLRWRAAGSAAVLLAAGSSGGSLPGARSGQALLLSSSRLKRSRKEWLRDELALEGSLAVCVGEWLFVSAYKREGGRERGRALAVGGARGREVES
jgi:hypothetical protein